MSDSVKTKLSEQEDELNSEIEEPSADKDADKDIETLIKQAQEDFEKSM